MCAVALALGGACDVDHPGEQDTVRFRPSTGGGGTGGMYLNTNALGKYLLSELDLDGVPHDGVRLDGVDVKLADQSWLTLDEVWSQDGEIRGRQNGVTYSGAAFVGSRWRVSLFIGAEVLDESMWVDAYVPVADGPPGYVFKYTDELGVAAYMCPADEHGGREVFALADLSVDDATGAMTTRARTLYLACTSGAVGKANTWGYVHADMAIADFEAAVRVVRADYCGDGVSWTVPGIEVQLVDAWGINSFPKPGAATEAIWGSDGALCLTTPRNSAFNLAAISCGGQPLPTCTASKLSDLSGALIWTKNAN